jgi:hypothetical protein
MKKFLSVLRVLQDVETQFKKKVKVLRSDNDT